MLRFISAGVARTCYFLARHAPGPWLITRIRRRDGLKWGVPAMLVSVPYFLIADVLKGILERDGNAWLSIPLLWCLVMGIAFLAVGPASLLLLAKARTKEAASRWKEQRHGRIAQEGGAERRLPSSDL